MRYAPASHFPLHQHPGGEEILVLSGTFSEGDEHNGAGWYLRNPPGSFHQPYSDERALIFVKLWQMRSDEERRVRIDTNAPCSWQRRGGRDVCPLFSDGAEHVALERVAPREQLFTGPVDGAELPVLAGELRLDGQRCKRGTWIRLPAGEVPGAVGGEQGATLYLKTGRLGGMTPGA